MATTKSISQITVPSGASTDTYDICDLTARTKIATTTTIGLIKVGDYLSIATDGTLSAKTATTAIAGVIKIGTAATNAAAGNHSHSGYAPTSHTHSAAAITSGTLAIARGGTAITTNPSMLVNLGSTSAATVFTTSPSPGVTGILGTANGGTGNKNGAAHPNIVVQTATAPTEETVIDGAKIALVKTVENSTNKYSIYVNFE